MLRLDDFYKEAGDPSLPSLPDGGGTDWDASRSWDAAAALRAVCALCTEGHAATPVYDIAASARTGTELLDLGGSPLFLAEGIFAAELTTACRELGLLADSLCLRRRALTTFQRRLLRDVREGRKPVPFLLRRGVRLLREESGIVARQVAHGARPCGRDEALARIAELRCGAGAVPAPRCQ